MNFLSAKNCSFLSNIIFKVFGTTFDNLKRVNITLVSSITPCKQSMRTKHDAANTRIFVKTLTKLQTEIKTRALPFNPADSSIKQFLRDALTVFGCSNCYSCIRMQVIDMFEWKKTV